MAITITFTYQGTTITLPVPGNDVRKNPVVPSAGIQTASGWFGYKLGAMHWIVDLRFIRLTAANAGDLAGFYESTVEGARREFTYTDGDGAAHTVRFLASPQFVRHGTGNYEATIRLRSSDRYL